jgi:magnesium chelatase family protein
LSDPDKECICTPNQVVNYRGRLSGPLVDRIDMFIEVPKVPIKDFRDAKNHENESSKEIKLRVQAAKNIQLKRFSGSSMNSNSEMKSKDIKKFAELSLEVEEILAQAVKAMDLSARSYYRIIKLSRTIADLENADAICINHILEALSYRKKDES